MAHIDIEEQNGIYIIGIVNDDISRKLTFDLTDEPFSSWFDVFGDDGEFFAYFRRPNEYDAYQIDISRVGNTLEWVPEEKDVSKNGEGKLQIGYKVYSGTDLYGWQKVMSDIIPVHINFGLNKEV